MKGGEGSGGSMRKLKVLVSVDLGNVSAIWRLWKLGFYPPPHLPPQQRLGDRGPVLPEGYASVCFRKTLLSCGRYTSQTDRNRIHNSKPF